PLTFISAERPKESYIRWLGAGFVQADAGCILCSQFARFVNGYRGCTFSVDFHVPATQVVVKITVDLAAIILRPFAVVARIQREGAYICCPRLPLRVHTLHPPGLSGR